LWNTVTRLSVIGLAAAGAWLAQSNSLELGPEQAATAPLFVQASPRPASLPAIDSKRVAELPYRVAPNNAEPIIERATPAGLPRLVEVKTSEGTWQGLDFGRLSNLLLLLSRDGQLQRFELDRGVHIRQLDEAFQPLAQRELEKDLQKEFGPKFKTLRTAHYVLCHNTADAYAQEIAELVEQLYRSFTAYFGGRGMGFTKPQFPMVVLIFDDESEFRTYLASSAGSSGLIRVSGIYSVDTNRIAMFNAAGRESKKYSNARWLNLSTVIHEATHQIAFNSGCHRRYADNPVWLAEGLATYFETPDIQGNKIAWNSIGTLNAPRIDHFATFRRKNRRSDSIKSLITTDDRFHNDRAAGDAYAESYALTYFLVQQRMPQFLKYMRMMAAKPSLEQDTPEQRLENFQEAFGQNLHLLETSFLHFVDDLPHQNSLDRVRAN
jgi:hypothetical protein